MADQPSSPAIAPPRGIYPARVDDKGRLKLPVKFQEFLGAQNLFVTTLDKRIARIYPIAIWEENEKLLAEQWDDPVAAADVSFTANRFGADSNVDPQGRVLMPPDLRRLLDMENQPVWLLYFKGGIDVYNNAVYEARSRRSDENLDEKVTALQKKGLK